jgi:hypothetical protein
MRRERAPEESFDEQPNAADGRRTESCGHPHTRQLLDEAMAEMRLVVATVHQRLGIPMATHIPSNALIERDPFANVQSMPSHFEPCDGHLRDVLEPTLINLRAAVALVRHRFQLPEYPYPYPVAEANIADRIPACGGCLPPTSAPTTVGGGGGPSSSSLPHATIRVLTPPPAPSTGPRSSAWDLSRFQGDGSFLNSRANVQKVPPTTILRQGDEVYCYSKDLGFKRGQFVSIDTIRTVSVRFGTASASDSSSGVVLQGPRKDVYMLRPGALDANPTVRPSTRDRRRPNQTTSVASVPDSLAFTFCAPSAATVPHRIGGAVLMQDDDDDDALGLLM